MTLKSIISETENKLNEANKITSCSAPTPEEWVDLQGKYLVEILKNIIDSKTTGEKDEQLFTPPKRQNTPQSYELKIQIHLNLFFERYPQ